MDYNELAKDALKSANTLKDISERMKFYSYAITDLPTRAEAAEYELEQRKGYYDQMVDALAAVDSRELEEAKAKLKAAEARAEKAERERGAAVKDLRQMCVGGNTCAFCKYGRNCGKQGPGRKTVEPCWEWSGQKEE